MGSIDPTSNTLETTINTSHHTTLTRGILAVATVLCMGSAAATDVAVPVGTAPAPTSTSLRQQEFALQLAKADLGKQGITEPTTEQLALATSNVQALRDKGMGWGAIANSLGLRLGSVVSAANRAEKAEKEALRKTRPHDTVASADPGASTAGVAPGRSSSAGGDGAGRSGHAAGGKGGGSASGNSGGNSGSGSGKGAGNSGGNSGGGQGGGNAGGNSGGKGGGNSGGRGKN